MWFLEPPIISISKIISKAKSGVCSDSNSGQTRPDWIDCSFSGSSYANNC